MSLHPEGRRLQAFQGPNMTTTLTHGPSTWIDIADMPDGAAIFTAGHTSRVVECQWYSAEPPLAIHAQLCTGGPDVIGVELLVDGARVAVAYRDLRSL